MFNPAIIGWICQQLATGKRPSESAGNCCPCGRLLCWMTNYLTKRYESFLKDEETINQFLENGGA